MPNRTPPRHVPTLTEVVQQAQWSEQAMVAHATVTHSPVPATQPVHAPLDRNALAQQVIQHVRPQMEAELRSIALELFEAQFSTLLPSLQLQIEEAVREAIDQALPERRDGHL